ncbi:MAG TPA: hypothetical protein VFE18_19525 [Phenylobacterium sp.]|jgi:hypothetical protein|uniref:hypothetical protein n=1 Tax=Phenylobacterium sp. TaxID=1871053 RepID=UPI002D386E83|nr:hypothetical protein [Phenylobacterium sp.]HZZ70367.1 hypothetical protein [Phenylobacterium sp.]
MSVQLTADGVIQLLDNCPSEDAETLLQHLSAQPEASVDWRLCDQAHAAVVQVLMAAGAELRGPPRGAFLREMVEPAMKAR